MDVDTRWLAETLPSLLPPFLTAQRWFGGKARQIAAADVEDVWYAGGDPPFALTVACVHYGDGSRERYALLLGLQDDPRDLPLIGRTGRSDLPACLVEAGTDPARLERLLRGFSASAQHRTLRGGRVRYGDVSERAAAQTHFDVRRIGAEQSNTTVRIDPGFVFKLFRRLAAGENPEAEVSRFLTTRTTFRAMPALHGSMSYDAPDGSLYTLGVLQEWISSQGDGWTYVLSRLGDRREPQAARHELGREIERLGRQTGEFHLALASDPAIDAFRPEPVEPADVAAWIAEAVERAAHVGRMVGSEHAHWPDRVRALGARLASNSRLPPADPAADGTAVTPLEKIRIHGDYHLGQTLKVADGFAIIDFEGEPARPIAERRLKHCALRDVAGMLRSFEYAAATRARRDAEEGKPPAQTSVDLRGPFLEGYLRTADRGLVPGDSRVLQEWMRFFELSKALYELEYELNNRPAWVQIPYAWIVACLENHSTG